MLTHKGHELLSQPRELHKLVTEKRNRDLKDLEFLLHKTRVYVNDADVTKEILKDICIKFGLNSPLAGEE